MLDGKTVLDIWKAQSGLRSHYDRLCSYREGTWRIDELNRPRIDGRRKTNLRVNFVEYLVRMHAGFVFTDDVQYVSYDENQDDVLAEFGRWYHDQDINERDLAHYANALLYGFSVEVHSYPDQDVRVDASDPRNWAIVKNEHGKPVVAIYNTKLPAYTMYMGTLLDSELELFYVYDDTAIHTYEVQTVNGSKNAVWTASRDHAYGRLPMAFFYLNPEWETFFSDALLSLIDNYAITLGSLTDDLKYSADSLLMTKGLNWEPLLEKDKHGTSVLEMLKSIGLFPLPAGADAQYLTKTTDVAKFSYNLDVSRSGIHLSGCTPDLQGTLSHANPNLSGTALKVLFAQLIQCSASHLKSFENGMRDRIALWNQMTGIARRSQPLANYRIVFNLNIPQNVLEYVQNASPLLEVVPRRVLYEILPFINDPDRVLREWESQESDKSSAEDGGPILTE